MKDINKILSSVEKPSRYIGGEYGEKDLKKADFNYCICFPDLYEVGMSNLGIKIVAEAIERVENTMVDRCFAPNVDFGTALKDSDIPLFSLGLKMPLKDFDMVGFSLSYEMCYTTVLYMLDLAGIPLRAKDRGDDFPIIQGGGPCACNPEPMADFFDLFVIGDGEESMADLARLKLQVKDKREFLRRASEEIEGVYVPSLMEVEYQEDGRIKSFKSKYKVKKSICHDLDHAPYPSEFLVPNSEAVFDRGIIEVTRGCYRGCRFCQAGFIYRPIRPKQVDTLISQACSIVRKGGFDELSVNSLSTGDYPYLKELGERLKQELPDINLSLPSLRLDNFDGEFAQETKKNTLTIAPEAGTQRLRNVINKDIDEGEIDRVIDTALKIGYNNIKLYFMMGLPTETEEDLQGIADIVYKIKNEYQKRPKALKALRISVSVSTFIPKPFTPFEWERQIDKKELDEKVAFLCKKLYIKGVNFSWNDFELSETEAILARGDRRLSDVIERVYRKGGYIESWSENFASQRWTEAFEECGLDKRFYTDEIPEDAILPWDFIDMYTDKSFLLRERKSAYLAKVTPNCLYQCNACGIQKVYHCDFSVQRKNLKPKKD